MKIKVYAPVNGTVEPISKLNDGVFSEKMLGDGFYIEATEGTFFSPIEKGKIALITDTKHAYFFEEENGFNVLMHIGLDTVNLMGKPFKTLVTENEVVSTKTKIVEVDLEKIKVAGLKQSCPITLDTQGRGFKFTMLKTGKVQQGDLVGEFEAIETRVESDNIDDLEQFFSADNIYKESAIKINKLVGGQSNYSDVYNCMTRLRFNVLDKTKVNLEEIEKVKIVKGTVWGGNQLMVIIGQDVFKVTPEVIEDNKKQNTNVGEFNADGLSFLEKKPWYTKFFQMFITIMGPLIPALIGTGLLQALVGVLTYAGVMPNLGGANSNPANTDVAVYWVILNAAARSPQLFLGILIGYNASKYFKLNMVVGVAISIILSSPLMFGTGGATGMGQNWYLFKGGELNTGIPVIDGWIEMQVPNGEGGFVPMHVEVTPPLNSLAIGPKNVQIFVIIATIWAAKKVDNWVASWMPAPLELSFRWLIVITAAVIIGFLPFGIIWFYIEKILGILFYFVSLIPFGLGIGIFVGVWGIAVVLGLHYAMAIIMITDGFINGGYGTFAIAGQIAVISQLGALIGVGIVTKNAELRRTVVSLIPAGIFGITEPILYQVNLPKKRPLFAGAVAAFIGGSIAGAMGVTKRVGSGMGIFEYIGFFADSPLSHNPEQLDPILNGSLFVLSSLVAFGLAIVFTMIVYKERNTEKVQIKSLHNQITKILLLRNLITKEESKTLLEKLNANADSITKEDVKRIKEIEKKYQKYFKLISEQNQIEESKLKLKDKVVASGKIQLNKNNKEAAKKLYDNYKIEEDKYDKLINDLSSKIKNTNLKDQWFDEFIEKNIRLWSGAINEIREVKQINDFEKITGNYKKIFNDLKIEYKLMENNFDSVDISKQIKKQKQIISIEKIKAKIDKKNKSNLQSA
ncbi:glucose PTS transporter subunit IIA [Spiroplasma endosymbiont of Othius punctulatus]|uniref:glucose PTS transporter subunit IIA n=1 Tax=Spiroplasma endosymbiont of Othius punctulatus TaxID=3066289 RepID=UPI0030D32161